MDATTFVLYEYGRCCSCCDNHVNTNSHCYLMVSQVLLSLYISVVCAGFFFRLKKKTDIEFWLFIGRPRSSWLRIVCKIQFCRGQCRGQWSCGVRLFDNIDCTTCRGQFENCLLIQPIAQVLQRFMFFYCWYS